MDEPTRNMFYQELLRDQEKFPRIIIFSTHLVSESDYLFDEVIIIHEGKILISDSYESVIEQGFSITGSTETVDSFISDMKRMDILNRKSLGNTSSVMLYGTIGDQEKREAKLAGLDVGPVSLQDLFSHLTKEEGAKG